jgi:hypothetical protein
MSRNESLNPRDRLLPANAQGIVYARMNNIQVRHGLDSGDRTQPSPFLLLALQQLIISVVTGVGIDDFRTKQIARQGF